MRTGRSLAAVAVLAAVALVPAADVPPAGASEPTPTIVALDPAMGPVAGGTVVTITGTDFRQFLTVSFGGEAGTELTIVNPTTLTVKTPPRVSKGPVPVVIRHTDDVAGNGATTSMLENGFTYLAPPAYVWIPRADGVDTGASGDGPDIAIVDVVNERVAGTLNLNATDPDLVGDLQWKPVQVLFDPTGATAFIASQGTPGAKDSQKVWVVHTGRAVGAEAGDPILATLDTDGNPYQLARSQDGNFLYVCDGGSWAAASFPYPDGNVRRYDVTTRANPVLKPATPVTVGKLPLIAYGRDTVAGWGTNSSFLGEVPRSGSQFAVTNVGSQTIQVLSVTSTDMSSTRTIQGLGVEGGLAQVTAAVPSPYDEAVLFVQTTSVGVTTGADPKPVSTSKYFTVKFRVAGDSAVSDKGVVSQPVQFFPLRLSLTGVSVDLHARAAWPFLDGSQLVTLPAPPIPEEVRDPPLAADRALVWRSATGSVRQSLAVQGGGLPTTLGYNDVTKLFYAREADGGWSVLGIDGGTLALRTTIADDAGFDSLRVVGDGKTMMATGRSAAALIQAEPTGTNPHAVRATVALPLDPFGGAVFPQPGSPGQVGDARGFVAEREEEPGPQIGTPEPGTVFSADDLPPTFTVGELGFDLRRVEIEIGTQRDFIPGWGNRRVRQRFPAPHGSGAVEVTPSARRWRRVLRAAARLPGNDVWVRFNAIRRFGSRLDGTAEEYFVEPADDL